MEVNEVFTQGQMLAAVFNEPTQKAVAAFYARAIREWPADSSAFRVVNEAIMNRWNLAGLKTIKRQAWRVR